MADTIDIVHKLIALATNNPNEAEAMAAALKAVQLIQQNNIPLGIVRPSRAKASWTAQEEADFAETVAGLMKRPSPDAFVPETVYPSFDLDDGFMKRRITDAWRRIREERAKIEAIYRRNKWEVPNWR